MHKLFNMAVFSPLIDLGRGFRFGSPGLLLLRTGQFTPVLLKKSTWH